MEDSNARVPSMVPLTKREKALLLAYSNKYNPPWSMAKTLRTLSRAFLLLKYDKAKDVNEALQLSEQMDKDKK